jgi:hypothetical protein
MKKRLLLNGIALYCVYVAKGSEQFSIPVESNFAHALEPGSNRATMPARQTAHTSLVHALEKLRFPAKPSNFFG